MTAALQRREATDPAAVAAVPAGLLALERTALPVLAALQREAAAAAARMAHQLRQAWPQPE